MYGQVFSCAWHQLTARGQYSFVKCFHGLLLHASVELIPAGLKEAVAAGGITWEAVEVAATEDALEVSRVCA